MSDIGALFSNYKSEAFRLEVYPQYMVTGEWVDYQYYLRSGEIIQNSDLKSYISEANQMIEKGKRHIRARIIPNPLTDYFVFECKVGYLPQSKIGFEFCFIEQSDDSLKKLNAPINKDFWLFDKSTVLQMYYDEKGSFLKAEISKNNDEIERCIRIRDLFINDGKTLSYVIDKYLKK